MNSLEAQVNNEIAAFKENVAAYEKLYQQLNAETDGNLSQANIEYLLALKKELLAASRQILTNIIKY